MQFAHIFTSLCTHITRTRNGKRDEFAKRSGFNEEKQPWIEFLVKEKSRIHSCGENCLFQVKLEKTPQESIQREKYPCLFVLTVTHALVERIHLANGSDT